MWDGYFTFIGVQKLRKLPFCTKWLLHAQVKQNSIFLFVHESAFRFYCIAHLSFIYWYTEEWLQKTSIGAPLMLPEEPTTKSCDVYLFACDKFAQKIAPTHYHLQNNDLTETHINPKTPSTFRFLAYHINISAHSTVPYLVRTLTNREQVMTDFVHILAAIHALEFQVLVIFWWCDEWIHFWLKDENSYTQKSIQIQYKSVNHEFPHSALVFKFISAIIPMGSKLIGAVVRNTKFVYY